MWGTWAPWRESPAPGIWATAQTRVLGAECSADVAAAWPRSQKRGTVAPSALPVGMRATVHPGDTGQGLQVQSVALWGLGSSLAPVPPP